MRKRMYELVNEYWRKNFRQSLYGLADYLIANGVTIGKDADVPTTDDDGCDFCRENWDDKTWEDGGAHDFRLSQNALFYYDPIFGWEGMDVTYCPKCGRELPEVPKEEAWRFLE